MNGRYEVTVARRQFEQKPFSVRMLIQRLQQRRPQELGRPENENVDGRGHWQGIDRCDGATHDHERVAAIAVFPPSGDAGGIKGGEEVWLIELERTTPRQHVEVAEWALPVESSPVGE
jgi:hypothetical protein